MRLNKMTLTHVKAGLHWKIFAAILAILAYSTILQIFVWHSPPSYEDQFWMYPRMGWNVLPESFFLKQNQPITATMFSGLVWMPLDWLASLFGASPMDVIFLVALTRMWIATIAIFFACLMVTRCYNRQLYIVPVAAFVSLVIASTFIFEQYLRFSGRYASLILGCLAVIAFASEIQLPQRQLRYSRILTAAGTVFLVPSLATNAANALATLVTVLLALSWSLTIAPLRASRLLVLFGFFTAVAAAIALPMIIQGGSSSWNDLADLRQATEIFGTTSWLDVLQGRGVWWESAYLTWSDQLDAPFRVWTRFALVLVIVILIPFLARTPLRYELTRLKDAPNNTLRLAGASGMLALLVTFYTSQRTQSNMLIIICIACLSWWVTSIAWKLASTEPLVARVEADSNIRVQRRLLIIFGPSLIVLVASLINLREQVILAVAILVLGIFRGRFALLITLVSFALITLSLEFPLTVGLAILGLGIAVLCLRVTAPRGLGSVAVAVGFVLVTGLNLVLNYNLTTSANGVAANAFLYNLPDKPSILLNAMGTIDPTCTGITEVLRSPTPYGEVLVRGEELSISCPNEFQVLKDFVTGRPPLFLEHLPALFGEFPTALALRLEFIANATTALLVILLFFSLLAFPPPKQSRQEGLPMTLRLLSGVFLLFNLFVFLFFTWIQNPVLLGPQVSKSLQLVASLTCLLALFQLSLHREQSSKGERPWLSQLDTGQKSFANPKYLDASLTRQSMAFGWFLWLVSTLLSLWLVSYLPVAKLIQISWLFAGFREPWAKFGSPFVISFALCLTLSISILISWLAQHRWRLSSPILVAAGLIVLALLPVRSQDNLLVDKSYLGTPTQTWVREIERLSQTAAHDSETVGFCFFPSQDLGADILSYRWFTTFTPNVPHRVEGLDLNPAYRQIGLQSYSCRRQERQVRWINVCNADNQFNESHAVDHRCSLVLPPIPREFVS